MEPKKTPSYHVYEPHKSKEQNQFELEKSLCEQYAINNNANVGSFVTLIAALFALFGAYGYIFANTGSEFSNEGIYIYPNPNGEHRIMTIEIFLFTSILVSRVLFFLTKLSLKLGSGQRHNQFVVERIRKKHYNHIHDNKTYEEIYSDQYNSEGKTWCTFVQDYFNYFYWLFFDMQILVFVSQFFKLYPVIDFKEITSTQSFIVITTLFILFAFICLSLYSRSLSFNKYNKLEIDSSGKQKIRKNNRCDSLCPLKSLNLHCRNPRNKKPQYRVSKKRQSPLV